MTTRPGGWPARLGRAGALALALAALAPQTHAQEAPIPRCRTDLAPYLEELDVPGLAAGIVKNGRLVCATAAGLAHIEQGVAVTPRTLFLVASISKTVTATALMQLFEQGRFKLDDDINAYLPFKVSVPAAPRAPITFRQLLTHTASIADNGAYINCSGRCGYGAPLDAIVTLDGDSSIPLARFTREYFTPGGAYYDTWDNFEAGAPGALYEYSNMGIVLAGYLVEVISGMPFDAYCREHIFKPLGMTKTSWRLAGIDRSILAMPYNKSWWSGFVPYGQFGEPNYPDGMLRTSVVELARFMIAYMQGGSYQGRRILKPATVKAMLRPQTPLDDSQGLVWYLDTMGGRVVWGHDGSVNGASARMGFDPERNDGVIVMANGFWSDEGALLERLFREADGY